MTSHIKYTQCLCISRIIQHSFRGCCFSCINMSNDTNVSNSTYICILWLYMYCPDSMHDPWFTQSGGITHIIPIEYFENIFRLWQADHVSTFTFAEVYLGPTKYRKASKGVWFFFLQFYILGKLIYFMVTTLIVLTLYVCFEFDRVALITVC